MERDRPHTPGPGRNIEVTPEMIGAASAAYYGLDGRWTSEEERFEAAIRAALKLREGRGRNTD